MSFPKPPVIASNYQYRFDSLKDQSYLSNASKEKLADAGVFYCKRENTDRSRPLIGMEYFYQCYYCERADSLENFLEPGRDGHTDDCRKVLSQRRVADSNANVAHGMLRKEQFSRAVPQAAHIVPGKSIERPIPDNCRLLFSNPPERPALGLANPVKKRADVDSEAHLLGEAAGGVDHGGSDSSAQGDSGHQSRYNSDNSGNSALGKNSSSDELSARRNTNDKVSALEERKNIEERPESQKKSRKKKKKATASGAYDCNKSMNTPESASAALGNGSATQMVVTHTVAFNLDDLIKSASTKLSKKQTLTGTVYSSGFDVWGVFQGCVVVRTHKLRKSLGQLEIGFQLISGPEDEKQWPFQGTIKLKASLGNIEAERSMSINEKVVKDHPKAVKKQDTILYESLMPAQPAFGLAELKPLRDTKGGIPAQYAELKVECSCEKPEVKASDNSNTPG